MKPKSSSKKEEPQDKPQAGGWKRYYSFLRENGLGNRLLGFTILFRVAVNFLRILGIGLLIPLAKGIIEQDFSFIEPVLERFSHWPYVSQIKDMEYFDIFFLFTFLIFFASTTKNFLLYFGGRHLAAKRLEIASNTNQFIFNNYLKLGRPFYDASEGTSESFFFLRFGKLVKGLLDGGDRFIDVFIRFISLSIVMFLISWELYLLSLLTLPLFLVFSKKMRQSIKESIEDDENGELRFPQTVNNTFSRLPLTYVHDHEDFEAQAFSSACEGFEKKKYEMVKRMSLIGPVNDTIVFIVLLFAAVFIGFLAHHGILEIAAGLVFFLTFKEFISMIFTLIMAQFGMIRALNGIGRAFRIIDKFEGQVVYSGEKIFKGLKKEIEIKNLRFRYPNGEANVLNGINISIPRGSIVSIIGRSGSGKSTLVNVLLRLYDCPAETIFLDGKDIREFSNKSVRSHVSFVGQDPILFKDTLYNNVVYGSKKRITKKKVEAILRSFSMGYVLDDSQDGLDMMVDQGGRNFSGGEKQRIALARALVSKAQIVILDEPTSAVDALTEAEIKSAIDEFTEGKTVIMLAHRLSTVKGSDKVAVMEYGKIVEKGDIKELLEADQRFAEYWKLQSLET